MKVRLHDVAHARAGDKGNLTTLALLPYDPRWYGPLRDHVTAERVRDELRDRVTGSVIRYELGALPALIFLCPRDPGDTVTATSHLDGHGKSLSSALLAVTIDVTPPDG